MYCTDRGSCWTDMKTVSFIYLRFFISFYTMNEKKNWFDFCYTSYCTISCNFFTFPVISSSRFSFTRLMMLYFKSSFRLLWCKFVSSSFLDSSFCYDWSTLVWGSNSCHENPYSKLNCQEWTYTFTLDGNKVTP